MAIYRHTYGPGERPTGARFRDEVRVCSGCRTVTISRLLGGEMCFGTTGRRVPRREAMSPDALERDVRRGRADLDELVDEPCPGIKMSPTAELGWRWLPGAALNQKGGARCG